jgi:soluble lytic murein transglycosylase-like protein
MLERFQSFIAAAAQQYGVPEVWIKAVVMTESSGDPMAYREEPRLNDASYGLMQLLSSTARGLGYSGPVAGLYDPATNINLGTKYLAQLRAAHGTNFQRIYSAYNSGSPDRYLSSSQVAANVERATGFLNEFLNESPALASSGLMGALLISGLAFYWLRKKGK